MYGKPSKQNFAQGCLKSILCTLTLLLALVTLLVAAFFIHKTIVNCIYNTQLLKIFPEEIQSMYNKRTFFITSTPRNDAEQIAYDKNYLCSWSIKLHIYLKAIVISIFNTSAHSNFLFYLINHKYYYILNKFIEIISAFLIVMPENQGHLPIQAQSIISTFSRLSRN